MPQEKEKRLRFQAWKAFEEVWGQRAIVSVGYNLDTIKLGLSQEKIARLWDEFILSKTAQTEPTGGYKELPILRRDERREILGPGLPCFVQAYVGWAVWGHIYFKKDSDSLRWLLGNGKEYLGNTEKETRILLGWMQLNTRVVANYLEDVWGSAKDYTTPFLEKAELGQLPKLRL